MAVLSIFLLLAFLCLVSSCSAEGYRKELRTKKGMNQETIMQLGHSIPSTRIDPSRVIQLSWRPRVFLYREFLSDEECDHLISLAHDISKKYLANDSDSREAVMGSLHSSSAMLLDIGQDDIVARIEDRISTWTFLPKESSKPLQVLHYGIEETKQRGDYYGDKVRLAMDEPVMATVVLYLSNVTRGGETLFPKLKFKKTHTDDGTWSDCAKASYSVKPIRGNALLIFSLHLNTAPDESSSHARCPVLEGDKWCATKFFHVRATEMRKIPSELDSDECTDEEESCPQWAALGECLKNPVYMIGSPDYYGSCRKSCKAC